MARRAPPTDLPEDKSGTHPDAAEMMGAEQGYFDRALFDLHYHLLAARTEGLPPLPDPEDYGITVDREGNVTRKTPPPTP